MHTHSQGEFAFDSTGAENGLNQWLAGRKTAITELARRLNLPLGHRVEVWLSGGVRLRGELRLKEAILFVEEDRVRHLDLIVDHVAFQYREIESWIRLD